MSALLIVKVGIAFAALTATAGAAQVQEKRLTPADIAAIGSNGAGAGTSGVAGIQSVVLAGDPTRPGLYTIEIRVPAHTRIDAHTHRDDRTAVVVSGRWYIGYGRTASDPKAMSLGPGSFYTEPAGFAHFAHTGAQAAIVYITGMGPTDTVYVAATEKPH